MSDALPVVYLARHGETAWTISRQHTGVTDLPLTGGMPMMLMGDEARRTQGGNNMKRIGPLVVSLR